MLSSRIQNRLRITAIFLLLINGINALLAGYSFITDPSGSGMGMSTSYLIHSPFHDFLIPGILLFVFNGILSMAIAIFTMEGSRYYPWLLIAQGAILTGWIIIQLMLLRFLHPLHILMLVVGIGLIVLGYMLKAGSK